MAAIASNFRHVLALGFFAVIAAKFLSVAYRAGTNFMPASVIFVCHNTKNLPLFL